MTNTKLTRIAWLSKRNPQKRFDWLMHHFDEVLREFHALVAERATMLTKAH